MSSTDSRAQQRTNGNTIQLVLDNVQKEDAGFYTINARSSTGTASRDIELRVGNLQGDTDEPPAFLRRLNDLSVKVGTRTRFLVEIKSSSELLVCIIIVIICFVYFGLIKNIIDTYIK